MRSHFPLYAIVSISGAVVLVIEIAGTRVLGPFYGVSLFLWSALITVTLAALSIGYAVGGRWADRGPRYGRLGMVLGLAGLWILATIWIKRPVIAAVEPLGLRAAVLAAATLLFFPPLALLGMVSPYAIRLRAEHIGEVGRTAGNIYAVGTVASVVGALATGFYLIPVLGINRLIACCAAALLAAAFIAFRGERGGRGAMVWAVLLPVGMGWLGTKAPVQRVGQPMELMWMQQSPYADLRVFDWEDSRYLLIDGGTHTIVDRLTGNTVFPYAMVLDIPRHMFDAPGVMLLIGLGGGSVAQNYYRQGWRVESVEIDPAVAEIAEQFFALSPDSARVTVMDGRRFLMNTDRMYDLIIIDAFGSGAIPFHMVTQEMFNLVKSRLSPGGVLAVNTETREWTDILMRSLSATVATQFDNVVALPTAEPPNTLGNVVLLASDRPLDIDEDALGSPYEYLPYPYRHWVVVERNHAWANRFVPDTRGAPVLTDDRNPVSLWSEGINWEARNGIHSAFAWHRLTY
ncbi:MAG: fused MFS/spermidine synthase [Candidatus Krumholzibacteria bacterium]|nr:fused MFS/spermidine synthase [Candidatus Krumholzibacteria bacterium]MDH4335799.1 fused MFS/spermidine synthase [Candidatus Krumholzibacteria bacterium]MDH5269325.1 fused MFS/spermidine synthase [Candidatus Krumholzibacteria bacterium]MDH5627231.1 fused MFS/spermidine synthase [Candidatus Krumholzibacteria bacterium]